MAELEYITVADMEAREAIIKSHGHILIAALREIIIDYLRDTRGLEIMRGLELGPRARDSVFSPFFMSVAYDGDAKFPTTLVHAKLVRRMAIIEIRLRQQEDWQWVEFMARYSTSGYSAPLIAYLTTIEAWDFACGRANDQMALLCGVCQTVDESVTLSARARVEMRRVLEQKLNESGRCT